MTTSWEGCHKQRFQDVDSQSKEELALNILTTTAINDSNITVMQCNPHVMPGLQEIIPSCRMNIEMTPAGGGQKVSMFLKQARKELKRNAKESAASKEEHFA